MHLVSIVVFAHYKALWHVHSTLRQLVFVAYKWHLAFDLNHFTYCFSCPWYFSGLVFFVCYELVCKMCKCSENACQWKKDIRWLEITKCRSSRMFHNTENSKKIALLTFPLLFIVCFFCLAGFIILNRLDQLDWMKETMLDKQKESGRSIKRAQKNIKAGKIPFSQRQLWQNASKSMMKIRKIAKKTKFNLIINKTRCNR